MAALPNRAATMRDLVDVTVDHMLLWLFVTRMDFGIPRPLATLCPILTYLSASVNLMLGRNERAALAYGPSTAIAMVAMVWWIDGRLAYRFLFLWTTVAAMSIASGRWGLVAVRGLVLERRHPIDLAFARIILGALVVYICSSKQSTDAMLLHNGADLLIPRDVASCNPAEQTDLPTGLPIPGLMLWPKFQFVTIHMEEKLLVLAAMLVTVGFCSRVSVIGMSILELRVFGQQFWFSQQLADFEQEGGVETMSIGLHHHHRHTLLMWASLMLILSPCSDVLSIDSLFTGLFSTRKPPSFRSVRPTAAHGLPINFTMLLLGIGYMGSGLAKAGAGQVFGLNWPRSYAFDEVINRHFHGYSELVARGVINKSWIYVYGESRSIREMLVRAPAITKLGSLAAMLWESSFLCLVSHKGFPRAAGMVLGLGFHAMVYMLTKISFAILAINYLVFVPWSRLFQGFVYKNHKLAIGFSEGSRAHQKMIQVLQSLDVGASLIFVGDQCDHKMELADDQNWVHRVHLPQAPISASEGEILNLLVCWVKGDHRVGKHLPHVYSVLRVCRVVVGFVVRIRRAVKEALHFDVLHACQCCQGTLTSLESVRMGTLMGCVFSVALLWTGLIGMTKGWPFTCLPRFVPPSLPSRQVLEVDHAFTSYSIIQAWAVGDHGKSSIIDLRPLLLGDPGHACRWELDFLLSNKLINNADFDELRKPLQCGRAHLPHLPLWYRWLTSWAVPQRDVTIGVNVAVQKSWAQVLKICWNHIPGKVGFGHFGKGHEELEAVCNKLQESVRIDFLRKGMFVQSGPPWTALPWDSTVKVHQIDLPPVRSNES